MQCLARILLLALLPGCTSIIVRPIDARPEMSHVCIQENPKVLVSDFLPVLRDGLSRHGITSEVFLNPAPTHCDFILTYTALRTWDFAPLLAHAEIRIERHGLQVGYGEFHLRGGGGYSVYKWQGTKTKMDPVIDQLFAAR